MRAYLKNHMVSVYGARSGRSHSAGSAMLTAAESGHLNCVQLTKDGQHVITASLCGPPQLRNVMVTALRTSQHRIVVCQL